MRVTNLMPRRSKEQIIGFFQEFHSSALTQFTSAKRYDPRGAQVVQHLPAYFTL